MPGRIRTIKPEWLEDQKLGSCDDAARLLSVGLILLADDHGNGRADPAWLASSIWPYDHSRGSREGLARVSGALAALVRIGYLLLYSVRDEAYFSIRQWKKHQRVDHPGKPHVPGPHNADSRDSRETPRDIPETLAPDLRPPTSDLRPTTDDQEAPRVSRSAPRRETAKPSATPPQSPLGLWFAEHWPDIRDPDGLAKSLHDAFPALDLVEQAKRALAWEHANPERAKKRHAPFFQRWLVRTQDGAAGGRLAVAAPPPRSAAYVPYVPPPPREGLMGPAEIAERARELREQMEARAAAEKASG